MYYYHYTYLYTYSDECVQWQQEVPESIRLFILLVDEGEDEGLENSENENNQQNCLNNYLTHFMTEELRAKVGLKKVDRGHRNNHPIIINQLLWWALILVN